MAQSGFRAVPNCIVRRSAHIAPGVVLMPCFVNLGAHVGRGTMVDTWATVGSCAQIGENVHLSGGVGIGGVLEPMQAGPTIIEDNCFIGARSEVVEGVIVREGSVLGMGVFLGRSTKIVDRETGQVSYGEVPPYSVVVAGSMASSGGVHLYCAVIVKRVDERTRSKTGDQRALARLMASAAAQVFTLLVEVGRKPGDGLPEGASGAALLCFAAARAEDQAVRETVAVLKAAGLAPLDVTGYGARSEREAAGHEIGAEEAALMARALAEDAVIVAETTVLRD